MPYTQERWLSNECKKTLYQLLSNNTVRDFSGDMRITNCCSIDVMQNKWNYSQDDG